MACKRSLPFPDVLVWSKEGRGWSFGLFWHYPSHTARHTYRTLGP